MLRVGRKSLRVPRNHLPEESKSRVQTSVKRLVSVNQEETTV
jgi:hypothetical protein